MEFVNANKGIALCKEGNYADAIPHLTKAIAVTMSPIWLLARAEAYTKESQFERALVDAEHAYNIAAARQHSQRLEQMLEAQYRRGVALFRLGRYADADACLLWAVRLGSGASAREEDPVLAKVDDNGFYNCTVEQAEKEKPVSPEKGNVNQADLTKSRKWVRAHSMRQVCLSNLARLPSDATERKLTVARTPNPPALVDGEYDPDGSKDTSEKEAGGRQGPATADTAATAAKPQQLRVDFFQNSANVTISIFCKGVDKKTFRAEVKNSRTIVLHNMPKEGDTPVTLSLAYEIEPGTIKQFVGSVKVELTLVKAQPGEKWKTWGTMADSSDPPSISQPKESVSVLSEPDVEDVPPKPEPIPDWVLQNKPPPYPTSSKSGPKDWEKLGDDDEEPQDVNHFFEKLYKGATPEARRAMMKSYTESNGTELSMDWSDVANRRVEVHPPEGVDVKNWDGTKRK
ncbi:hypothetical protein PpBr36_07765 [Pyricularia pennisetigena]|uniref:hypothetical protein n=1 Tax=Pyricularia pennisetigena TaxID=1578925 RepID=UPI00114E5499|nr:hypothetical protein PpBr36_07765 [Pyricularia pennisetigena]TLS25950.1 hypothetical protein PpBr36_07765 [Pyricularia pennisetigena]